MSGRYRVKIMGLGPYVGVWDTLASDWVADEHGVTWSTGDVSHAQWLANSLSDTAKRQYDAQASVIEP